MTEQQITIAFPVPVGFIEMAAACGENLPEVIDAKIDVRFVGDNWEVYVEAISADGIEIDKTWLDETSGYQFSLRQQIKLNFIQSQD